ncbi:hypothetical protein BDV97DRAFT_342910 [Delphinella strobiligena]|nr:hypothetical protein BDV97DRAFT_342910 [Delphinella strobiligena]
MSEYWKSTPKYWCKFCSLFVRDTGLEKKQHEATPKHQSNIQRSLRNLHKNTEREEREKQRAKDEVARLNGLVGGKPSASGSTSGPGGFSKTSAPPAQASAAERKRQMEQLASMGVVVPQEYRKELPSIGGEWTTVSETPIYNVKEEDGDSKAAIGTFGVRKRKLDEDEEEAEAVVRKGWGSKLKTYPGSKGSNDEDLDALLNGAVIKKKEIKKEDSDTTVNKEDSEAPEMEAGTSEAKDVGSNFKKEESVGEPSLAAIPDVEQASASVKQEEKPAEPPVVFKKRKGKR